MSTTKTPEELLELCIWDLKEACRLLAARVPRFAHTARNAALGKLLEQVSDAAEIRAKALEPHAPSSGPANIWMTGVLDDGERDTRSIEPGPLLDTALIGAVRKGLKAEIASIDTALALARVRKQSGPESALESNLDTARAHDRDLAKLLAEITAAAGK